MWQRPQRFVWIALVAICCTSVIVLIARERHERAPVKPVERFAPSPPVPRRNGATHNRNLALQPEAFKLSRRLGERFIASQSEVSVLIGEVSTDSGRYPIQITRRQSERGERVDIRMPGKNLSWDAAEGAKVNGSRAHDFDRHLVERLAFDSADEFVLAQLRGASYQVIARSVRADEGGADNYQGPLWTIVRIDDPDKDVERKREANWKLYYVNAKTGLIDKVVSESGGERVEANLSSWTTDGGETFPSAISWIRGGRQIMEFKLNTFVRPTAQ